MSSSRLDRYVPYEDLPQEDFSKEYLRLLSEWQSFLDKNSPGLKMNTDYFVHKKNLYEVIRRVDKRKVYYKVFHELDSINELKRTAILCYWINTLKPFLVVKSDCNIYSSPNELFSVFLVFVAIRSAYEEVFPGNEFKYPCAKRISDIVYNFKYCDLSREAMISFVETLADNYGVGIEYIKNHSKDE